MNQGFLFLLLSSILTACTNPLGSAGSASVNFLSSPGAGTSYIATMDSSWTPQWSSVIGYYPLDGALGNIANGSLVPSGVGPLGTVVNLNNLNMTYAAGYLGQALSFNAVDDDYVTLPNATLAVYFPVSMSVWLKLNSLGPTYSVFSSDGLNTLYAGYSIIINPAGTIEGFTGSNSGTGPTFRRSKVSSTALTTGTWYHVVVVIQSTTNMQIYINGIDAGGVYSGTGGPMAYGTAHKATIGHTSASGPNNLNGMVDELTVWSSALLPADAATIYQHQSANH